LAKYPIIVLKYHCN